MAKVFQRSADHYVFSGKSTQDFVDGLSQVMKELGNEQHDFEAEMTKRVSSGRVTKANEWEHTTNTGFGAELVPVNVLTSPVDLIASSNSFLAELQSGYKGNRMDKTQKVPILGNTEDFFLASESTTGALLFPQGDTRLPTDEVTIEQKKLRAIVSLSDELQRYSIVDAATTIINKLTSGWTEQLMSVIINGDTTTAGTGNVNSDDQAPTAGTAYLGFTGLRRVAITGGATTSFDATTLTFDDLVQLKTLLGLNGMPDETIFLTNPATYNKMLGLTEFKDQSLNAYNSTVRTGQLLQAMGSPIYVNKKFPLTEADGKMSGATPANNVKGGIIALNKNAVQWGTNGEFSVELVRSPGYGWNIVGYGYFGFAIANQKAGDTSPMLSLAYNITV